MGDVVPFGGARDEGGAGPEDPMLEQRITRLEEIVADIRASLKAIEEGQTKLREDVGYIKGALSRVPGPLMNWSMIVSTWIAGAGIVALAIRLLQP